jgi:peroxiredoxin
MSPRLPIAALAMATLVMPALVLAAPAGEFNKKLSAGDAAPTWADLPGVDGKKHSFIDLKDKEIVVVVFTCSHCPVARAYEDRLIAFTKKFAGPESKVAVVAINVNNIDADRLPKMKERAEKRGFNFRYLYDETQRTARAYGATMTPEFFVLDRARKVVYLGAFDDSEKQPTVNYVEMAIEAALKGERPAKVETKARGCTVKYENVD